MSRTLTALKVTPGVTYTTRDGSPYRADWTGIVHVTAAHATELAAASAPKNQHGDTVGTVAVLAAASDLKGTIHDGWGLSITVENS